MNSPFIYAREKPAADIPAALPAAPLITVGIPAYNRPELLRETLRSLSTQIDFTDFEVVICDDLGLPATRSIVEDCGLPRVRYYANPRRLGAVANWNRCLELAEGKWTTILHEDDTLYPWFFSHIVPHLDPSLSAIVMKVKQGPVPPALLAPAPARSMRRYKPAYFLKSGITPFPGVLFPTALGRQLGGFDERRGALADYDFWYRLGCSGPVEIIPTVGAFYRVADEQWTARVWPDMLRKMHLLRIEIARQQLPNHPRLGRWMARYFTYRNACCYDRRFTGRPAILARTLRFKNIPLQKIPSGWIWLLLRVLAPSARQAQTELSAAPQTSA